MTTTTPLQRDLTYLSSLFDVVLEEQAGPEAVRLVKQLRGLAKERRVGVPGAADRLVSTIQSLNEAQIAVAIRAFSLTFDLANLAEDLQRVRVLREREATGTTARRESIGDAIQRLTAADRTGEEIQQLLDRLRIDLVFTAHPTEAKRRTTRRILRRLRNELRRIPASDSPREMEQHQIRLLSDLTLLWQVDSIRPNRPTVLNELERGLFFFDGLWEVVPQLRADLRRALAAACPDHEFRVPAFLSFGSWIGGDRDGNPFVTADISAQALERLRRSAIERHLQSCQELAGLLVMSCRSVEVDPELVAALEGAIKSSALRDAVSQIAEVEVYRRWLKVIQTRLQATLAAAGGTQANGLMYSQAEELCADVRLLAASLRHHKGQRIVHALLDAWIDQIETFGLQFAALDVRQDSRVHVDVLTEIFQKLGLCDDFSKADESTRQQLLSEVPATGNEILQHGLSEQARETLSLFKMLVRIVRAHGAKRLGGHVISMTHQPSDLLAVLWFWRWAWKATPGDDTRHIEYLPIIPLFETIDDLRRGPEILSQLLSLPAYREYLQLSKDREPTQIVMVGYSDSTKDGGYLAACWGLYQGQDKLAEVAQQQGLRLVIFHGRGGALGRGGGPAARAILSLPPYSVDGALRMTEQGEVLAERYDDPDVAHRHLEQVTWATLLVSGEPQPTVQPDWMALLDRMSRQSYKVYRHLVEHPGFLAYFDLATPISEIERLPIGSRPSRRRERKSLSDLRAIPWTFAWTQSRQFLPAWYGLGSALLAEANQPQGWTLLQELYETWPMFQALIDNAVLALAKADMGIAQRYAELTPVDSPARAVWSLIEAEFQQTQSAVLMITREPVLLANTPWLQRSIQERNPSVDPLNLIQIELIRRMRSALDADDEETANRLGELARFTIQGVASGLRTTG